MTNVINNLINQQLTTNNQINDQLNQINQLKLIYSYKISHI